MNTILILMGILISLALLFVILQWFSDRTYKPTKEEIKQTIQETLDGTVSLSKFDEFSSVHIAYDKKLEEIRNKYNQILDNPECYSSETTNSHIPPLNEAGKSKLAALINELY